MCPMADDDRDAQLRDGMLHLRAAMVALERAGEPTLAAATFTLANRVLHARRRARAETSPPLTRPRGRADGVEVRS